MERSSVFSALLVTLVVDVFIFAAKLEKEEVGASGQASFRTRSGVRFELDLASVSNSI